MTESVYVQLVKANNLTLAKQLLVACDPSTNDNEALVSAFKHGTNEMIKLLLEDPRTNLTEKQIDDIIAKPYWTDADVLNILLENSKIKLSVEQLGRVLDKIWRYDNDRTRNFKYCVANILSDPNLDPICYDNLPIAIATFNGLTENVQKLLTDPSIDPRNALTNSSYNRNFVFRTACKNNDKDILKILLNDSRINVAECINDIKIYDFDPVHTLEFVESVQKEISIKNDNKTLHIFRHGTNEMIKLLMEDPRTNLTEKQIDAIVAKPYWTDADGLNILLENSKIKLSAEQLGCVLKEIWCDGLTNTHGFKSCVANILSNPNLDPICCNNLPILMATLCGLIENVQKLLTDPSVDPRNARTMRCANRNYVFRIACSNKDKDILKILLNDSRINATECIEDIKRYRTGSDIREFMELVESVQKEMSIKNVPENELPEVILDQAESPRVELPEAIPPPKFEPHREFYICGATNETLVFMDSVSCINKCSGTYTIHLNNGQAYSLYQSNPDYAKFQSKYNF